MNQSLVRSLNTIGKKGKRETEKREEDIDEQIGKGKLV